MNTAQLVIAIVSAVFVIVGSLIGATWALSNKIQAVRAEVSEQMGLLRTQLGEVRTELAVMKQREEQRAEKLEQMWKWWLKSIEGGWIAHMKAASAGNE